MQSVRLHLDKRVESSTPFSATTTSEPSAWNNGEPPAPPLSLSIALRGLMAGAEALHDGVDFANFVNIAESPQLPFFRIDQTQWKRVERSSTFTLLKRDDKSCRRAAFLVLEQLLLIDQKEAQVQADKNAELLSAASERQQPTEAAKRAMDVSKCRKDLDACKFASADSRPYPMMPALIQNEEGSKEVEPEPIIYPIPANEDERLAAIEHFRLHDVANVPELNVICSLAAAEMKAPHSVITLVERDVVTLLATNAPEYWDVGTGNPREQTFCQHFVMDDKPLLVRHAEADMRFYHIAPVTMRSLRFYAGFPVSVPCVSKTPGQPERVVIGALCCLDEKPHEMTRSQYWRLMKLADAASNILERTAKEYIADPENHPLGQNCIRGQTFAEGKGAAMVTC
ncbi:GAF domain-like [Phytophthora cactorum]|nr:GAF domain-like [Phytophthora cactorum]